MSDEPKEVMRSDESMQLPDAVGGDCEASVPGSRQSARTGVTHPATNTSRTPAEPLTDDQDPEWRLLKNIQSWGNSVAFTMHERLDGRATQNDAWLMDVGQRIIAAADDLLRLRRERRGGSR